MQSKRPHVRIARVLLALGLTVVSILITRITMGPTWAALVPTDSLPFLVESEAKPIAIWEPNTEKTAYPSQISWAWVSAEHPMSTALLAGGACAKCHQDSSARAALWPTWADPPTDHKLTFGCASCHGVVPRPELQAGTRVGVR